MGAVSMLPVGPLSSLQALRHAAEVDRLDELLREISIFRRLSRAAIDAITFYCLLQLCDRLAISPTMWAA